MAGIFDDVKCGLGHDVCHQLMARDRAQEVVAAAHDQCRPLEQRKRFGLITSVPQSLGLAHKNIRPQAHRNIHAEVQDGIAFRRIGKVVGFHLVTHDPMQISGQNGLDLGRAAAFDLVSLGQGIDV